MAAQARALLTNGGGRLLEPQQLRENDTARAKVAAGMAEVKAKLDTMVQAAPRRRIQVSSEEKKLVSVASTFGYNREVQQ